MSAPESRATRSLGATALVLLGLTGPTIAQPLYQLVAQYPEFFVAHRATRADILVLIAMLSIALPLLAVGLAWLAGRISTTLQDRVADTFVAILVTLFAVQALKQTGVAESLAPWPLLALSLALGAVAALAHARFPALQSFGAFLAVGVLVFPVIFLLQPAIWKIVFPERLATSTTGLEHADTPVVLLVFDQLPVASLMNGEGEIDAIHYPNFAALLDEGTWYRNASAVGNKSAWAVPAILTGQYPDPDKLLPSWLDYPVNLFSLLHPRYSIRAEEPVTQLCPPEVCASTAQRLSLRVRAQLGDLAVVYAHVVVPPAWSSSLPPLTDNWKDFGASASELLRREYSTWVEDQTRWDFTDRWVANRDSDRRTGFNDFVAAIGSERQPALYFMHLLLPHEPYEFLPSGRSYLVDSGRRGLLPHGRWVNDPAAIQEVYQRHLLQLAHVDGLLGELVAKLKETGLYDRALLVVTADHGAAFLPGEMFKDPSAANYADILSVPLFVKTPGQRAGRVDDRTAETVDVMPTIADVLGVDVDWAVDGRSLLGEPDPPRQEKTMLAGSAHRRYSYAVADVIARRDATVDRKLELFGPAGDPLRGGPGDLDQQLVGRRVDELRRGESADIEVILDYASVFARVAPESDFIPARLSGIVSRTDLDADLPDVQLAVAINGRVEATARPTPAGAAGTIHWAAIVPEEVFVAGANRIDVYSVEWMPEGPLLRLAYEGDVGEMGPANLVLPESERLYGVEIDGFRNLERASDGVPLRWTAPNGLLRVPIDPEDPPVGLDLFVRNVDARGHRLRIRVNGCWVFHRRVRNAFKESVAFGDCLVEGSELVLELVSDRWEGEPREIGVGVSSIVLLYQSTLQQ